MIFLALFLTFGALAVVAFLMWVWELLKPEPVDPKARLVAIGLDEFRKAKYPAT